MSQYTTGTLTTDGTNAVVGVGTMFSANVTVGDLLNILGSKVSYFVTAVTDNTHLTVDGAIPAGAGQSYNITRDIDPVMGLPLPSNGARDTPTIIARALKMIGEKVGGVTAANRVVYTDADGLHASSAGLTYDGTTFVAKSLSADASGTSVAGTGSFTGAVSIGSVVNALTMTAPSDDYSMLRLKRGSTVIGQLGAGSGGEVVLNAAGGSGTKQVFVQVAGSNVVNVTAAGSTITGKLTAGGAIEEATRFNGQNGVGSYSVWYDATSSATRGYVGYGDTLFGSGGLTNFGIRSQGDLLFSSGGVVNSRLNSAGNVGFGVVPSSWSAGKAVEVGNVGSGMWGVSGDNYLTNNYYYSSGDKFAGTGYASYYVQLNDDGSHRWYSSTASGSAGGTPTMTKHMQLDQNRLTVSNTGDYQLRMAYDNTASTSYDMGRSSSTGRLVFYGNQTGYTGYEFTGVDGERARITTGGYFKATSNGSYVGASDARHELYQHGANDIAMFTNAHGTTPYGIYVYFPNAAPDNNTQYAINFQDSVAQRYVVYSDGDVLNHDGTYGTISDEFYKDMDAAEPARSQWEDVKRIPFLRYRNKSDIAAYGDEARYLLGPSAQGLIGAGMKGLTKKVLNGYRMDLGVKTSIMHQKVAAVMPEVLTRIERIEQQLGLAA